VRRYRGFDRVSRAAIIEALQKRDGFICWICRGVFDPSIVGPDHPAALTIDHVVPIGEGGEIGGPTRLTNLRLAHSLCNGRRVRFADREQKWFADELRRALSSRNLN
jgi:5-methylcytosine-specific restriction endonuclease McrA